MGLRIRRDDEVVQECGAAVKLHERQTRQRTVAIGDPEPLARPGRVVEIACGKFIHERVVQPRTPGVRPGRAVIDDFTV